MISSSSGSSRPLVDPDLLVPEFDAPFGSKFLPPSAMGSGRFGFPPFAIKTASAGGPSGVACGCGVIARDVGSSERERLCATELAADSGWLGDFPADSSSDGGAFL